MTKIIKPNITEGEWAIEKHNHTDGEVWLTVDKGAIDVTHNVSDDKIASQRYSITKPEERIANAKAISSVPEMIDALIEAYNMADNLSKNANFSYSISGSELKKRFKKALLKAGCTEVEDERD
ncbi:MAG: hypothetical protein RIE52_12040 [Balneola sp.]